MALSAVYVIDGEAPADTMARLAVHHERLLEMEKQMQQAHADQQAVFQQQAKDLQVRKDALDARENELTQRGARQEALSRLEEKLRERERSLDAREAALKPV